MKTSRISTVLLAAALGSATMASAGTITVDATSGSSIKVTSATCTSTGATVSWTYNKTNGIWRLYYGTTDVAAPTTTGWASTASPTSKTATLSGLTAGTRYYALLAGWEGGVSSRAQSYAHMSFTTDGGTISILDRPASSVQPAPGYDAFGRRMGRIPASSVQFSTQGAGVRIQR